MNVAGLATGFSNIGRYILSRKEEERKLNNQLALENLKNTMWNRRLQEETRRQEIYRQSLENIAARKQEEETARAQIKADYDAEQERLKREAEEELNKWKIRDYEARIKGKGYYSKKGVDKDDKSNALKELELALKLREQYGGKYYPITTEEGGVTTRGYEQMGQQPEAEYANRIIQQSAEKIYGVPYTAPAPPSLDLKGKIKYYKYLNEGNSPPLAEAKAKMDIFNEKNPPKKVTQQPKQEPTVDSKDRADLRRFIK